MLPFKFKTRSSERHYFDYTLLFVVIFLILFGLVMIYSTSSYVAARNNGDSAFYLKKQLLATVFGFVAMFFATKIDYHFWERLVFPGLIASCVLVLLVLSPLGVEVNGARRWIYIGPLSLQPAEIVKIAIILYCAVLLTHVGKNQLKSLKSTAKILMIPVIFAAMIYIITDNLSSAIIVIGIACVMLFIADPDYSKYIIVFVAAAVVITLFVIYVNGIEGTENFRFRRIQAWLNPEEDSGKSGFQTLQALYAIGSGGIFGKGLGGSMQKLGFLPEAQNDMIFSIVCEELGLFGAIAIIALFILLIWRCMIIANNAPDLFGSMLVIGVMSHFAIQVILNIAVVTNSIPNTGISLPFISYGGTSVLFLMAEIGLVLNVSKQISFKN